MKHCAYKTTLTLLHPLTLLTIWLSRFLPQTRHDVSLQLSQRRWLQSLKVYLDLLGVGVSERGLAGLNDVNDAAQLLTGQLVDVQAELTLLVIRHGCRLLLLIRVEVRHYGLRDRLRHVKCHACLFGSDGRQEKDTERQRQLDDEYSNYNNNFYT